MYAGEPAKIPPKHCHPEAHLSRLRACPEAEPKGSMHFAGTIEAASKLQRSDPQTVLTMTM